MRHLKMTDLDAASIFAKANCDVTPELRPFFHSFEERQRVVERGGYGLFEPSQQGLLALILYQNCDEALEVLVTATHIAHRRKSYMFLLLKSFMSQHGCPVWLEVAADNTPARALYQKLEFCQVGVRPRYYPSGQDALLMSWQP